MGKQKEASAIERSIPTALSAHQRRDATRRESPAAPRTSAGCWSVKPTRVRVPSGSASVSRRLKSDPGRGRARSAGPTAYWHGASLRATSASAHPGQSRRPGSYDGTRDLSPSSHLYPIIILLQCCSIDSTGLDTGKYKDHRIITISTSQLGRINARR